MSVKTYGSKHMALVMQASFNKKNPGAEYRIVENDGRWEVGTDEDFGQEMAIVSEVVTPEPLPAITSFPGMDYYVPEVIIVTPSTVMPAAPVIEEVESTHQLVIEPLYPDSFDANKTAAIKEMAAFAVVENAKLNAKLSAKAHGKRVKATHAAPTPAPVTTSTTKSVKPAGKKLKPNDPEYQREITVTLKLHRETNGDYVVIARDGETQKYYSKRFHTEAIIHDGMVRLRLMFGRLLAANVDYVEV